MGDYRLTADASAAPDAAAMNDLEAIVAAHSEAVWRTAYRLLNHHEDALDCYQETFLAAMRLARGDEIRHWRTLLVRIATRRAIDRLRRRYRAEKASNRLERQSAVEAPDARAQSEELREQVRRALAQLPAQQAEAFWLRHLEQMSPGDVAQQMGIEPAYVRVLVHRAAAGLRALLGASYGPAPISEESP